MDADNFISKTRRKRQMRELQDVGAALVKLSPEVIQRLQLPEALREAVLECKRFTKHEAIRRQMQYIGRIMRALDTVPIMEQVAALDAPTRRQAALFHLAERCRKDLVADFPYRDSMPRLERDWHKDRIMTLRRAAELYQKEPDHFLPLEIYV